MAFTEAQVQDLFDRLESLFAATGYFRQVNTHEPKGATGGLTAAIWLDYIGPSMSGVNSTSGLVVFYGRVYQPMLSEPQDAIDPDVAKAVNTVFGKLAGNFDLGGTIKAVDLRGMSGRALSAQAGYVTLGQELQRVVTITIPLLVNDMWSEANG